MHITQIPGYAYLACGCVWRRFRMWMLLPLFHDHGRNVWFDPDGSYSFRTISVGSDVFLGIAPTLSSITSIRIGSKVMFGPHVTIMGGNHNTGEMGRFMADVTEKREDDDPGVVIEDDVWIGASALILPGVTVGRGAIVGAGSVVTRSVPPYAVVTGCPARVRRLRWDLETILRHEQMLYPPEARIPSERLAVQGQIATARS